MKRKQPKQSDWEVNWFALPLLIVAIPLAAIAGLIDWPITSRNVAKIKQRLQKEWLPDQKFALLAYKDSSAFKDYFEKKLIPKYEKHLVIFDWDRMQAIDDKYTNLADKIDNYIIRDYDGVFEETLVVIDKELNLTDIPPLFVDDYKDAQKETETLYDKKLRACIEEWLTD